MAKSPGGGTLVLYESNGEYMIRIDGWELMTTLAHQSEDLLAAASLESVRCHGMRVLVGGLGLGFTLRALLDKLDGESQVVVAELVPEVVEWNRRLVGSCAGWPLDDQRVSVEISDVGAAIKRSTEEYDLILLDVDNGPQALSRNENDWLYLDAGLNQAFCALRPGGTLSVWSGFSDAGFVARLENAGFAAETRQVSPRAGERVSHTLFFARKPIKKINQ